MWCYGWSKKRKRRDLPFVYLGYWVESSRKMAYKSGFRPLEGYGPDGWQRLGVTLRRHGRVESVFCNRICPARFRPPTRIRVGGRRVDNGMCSEFGARSSSMKRRNFLTGAGVAAGATTLASALPRPAIAQDRLEWKMVTSVAEGPAGPRHRRRASGGTHHQVIRRQTEYQGPRRRRAGAGDGLLRRGRPGPPRRWGTMPAAITSTSCRPPASSAPCRWA